MPRQSLRVRHRADFTLIEMLVVITLIALLAALLMPALLSSLNSARQAACSNNLRQLGTWGMQYAGDWNGVLPHSGGSWAGYFRGYANTSTGGWLGKNPNWQSEQLRGTALHCPQESALAPPFTAESYNPQYWSNTYALSLHMGGGHGDATYALRPPRITKLSAKAFWFCDGGAEVRSDGRYAYSAVVDLNVWSGTLGRYVPFPYYFTWLAFHPGQSANFVYGDGHAAPLPHAAYLGLNAAQKTTLNGG